MKLQTLSYFCILSIALAFHAPTASTIKYPSVNRGVNPLILLAESRSNVNSNNDKTVINSSLKIPLSYNEMISQASQAMTDAYNNEGCSRQIVRILLPRDAKSGLLGEYFESDVKLDKGNSQDMKLVPTDESWQGGIMQLYRAASPAAKDILRQLCPTGSTTGVPPKIVEDRTIDESGVDGIGLLYTQTGGNVKTNNSNENESSDTVEFQMGFGNSISFPVLSQTDMCVFVQPTQEVVDVIEAISTSTKKQTLNESPIIALLNPQWRNVDDALDEASRSNSIFGALASFLGGKGSSLRKLEALGYRNTYILEGYVCMGGNIRLMKRFDSDWVVFAENDNGDSYVEVGISVDRPSYQDVEKMLQEKGVGYKYARDLGLAPKL